MKESLQRSIRSRELMRDRVNSQDDDSRGQGNESNRVDSQGDHSKVNKVKTVTGSIVEIIAEVKI